MMVAHVAVLLLITAALLGVLWLLCRHAPAPQEVGWEEVLAAADSGGYLLISTKEMADRYRRHLRACCWWILGRQHNTSSGHIQGAVNLPLTPTWWGRWRSRMVLAKLLGPGKQRFVVFS